MTTNPPVLGVDIDGVLNDHRTHFCCLLKLLVGKHLHPEEITAVPVHNIPNCDVTESDEAAVFNWPDYWTKMPPLPDASASIARIRAYGMPVWVYTRRPWPSPGTFPDAQGTRYWRAWRRTSWWSVGDRIGSLTLLGRFRVLTRVQKLLQWRAIYLITKRWLRQYEIPYDRLTIETTSGATAARYVDTKGGRIHSFVEDIPENARALAALCQRVYLIDQPYNRVLDVPLPSNVRRVHGWEQIEEDLLQRKC